MNVSAKEQTFALGLVESTLTVVGVVAAITPLALWASWSEFVFYLVLSVGCGSFLVFIALSKVRGYLMGEEIPANDFLGLKGVRQRMEDWDRLQEEDPMIGRRQRSIKGDAKREFSFMMRVAVGLILTAAAIFTGVWALFEMYYGS